MYTQVFTEIDVTLKIMIEEPKSTMRSVGSPARPDWIDHRKVGRSTSSKRSCNICYEQAEKVRSHGIRIEIVYSI
jgi:hypothetical protein